jgi:hypothetical protein
MRRALLLSMVLVSGCHQGSAPPAGETSAQKAERKAKDKEMSDLLRKADAITAVNTAPAAVVPLPVPAQPAPLAKAPVAPADTPHVAPAKSKTDVMRDQAAAAFGDRLGTLRRTAEASRLKKDQYQKLCQGKSAAKAQCQDLTTDVTDAAKTIERELGDIDEAARRAQIDPGVMHDLLAKYGF